MEKRIRLTKKQNKFFEAQCRFPAMIAGWATGKTMVALIKSLELSQRFPNNLGLIGRKKFTDLRDSTIKDFERYTGISVPLATKEITLSNGSVIMFRHAEQLSLLQNINLGWFMIEQAEEFETAEQFDMLRGRLRREGCFHQGIVIGNTCGHNWIWQRWKGQKLPEYNIVEATSFENRENLPADFLTDLERLKTDSPRKYQRFVMNSWEDYEIEGAYFATLISDALKQNRVGLVTLFEPSAPVYTFWDLGLRASDTTAIWLAQFIGNEIWLIDYYENYGEGIEHYSAWLSQQKYSYGAHYLPHDARQRLQGKVVETRQEILEELRPNERVIPLEPSNPEDRIQLIRGILPRCRFNEKCRMGVEALNHYTAKKNEILSTDIKPVFLGEPLHDWSSNAADALGYLACAYRYEKIGDERIGLTTPEISYGHNVDLGVRDLLEV